MATGKQLKALCPKLAQKPTPPHLRAPQPSAIVGIGPGAHQLEQRPHVGHEAARVHLAGRRCGGDVANGTPAAAEEWDGPAVLSA